jgi:hypothetical protein
MRSFVPTSSSVTGLQSLREQSTAHQFPVSEIPRTVLYRFSSSLIVV